MIQRPITRSRYRVVVGVFALVIVGLVANACSSSGMSNDSSASLISTSASMSDTGGCKPGERAELHIRRVPRHSHVRLLSPVLVLGCGRLDPRQQFQIVAFRTTQDLCTAVDWPSQRETHSAYCTLPDSTELPCADANLCLFGSGTVHRRTEVVGVVSPGVKRVIVKFRLRKQWHQVSATIGYVAGSLARRLKVATEFGPFVGTIHGCVPPSRIRVVGLGSDGSVLARAVGQNLVPGPCDHP